MTYIVGKSKIKKHCYSVYVRPTQWSTPATLAASTLKSNDGVSDDADWNDGTPTTSDSDFGLIGQLDENPSGKVSEGESKSLASCSDVTISENIEIALKDLQVSKDNYEALRALFKLGNVDILFYDSDYATESVGFANIGLMAFLEITGNDLNGVVIEGSRELADSDSAVAIFEVT